MLIYESQTLLSFDIQEQTGKQLGILRNCTMIQYKIQRKNKGEYLQKWRQNEQYGQKLKFIQRSSYMWLCNDNLIFVYKYSHSISTTIIGDDGALRKNLDIKVGRVFEDLTFGLLACFADQATPA